MLQKTLSMKNVAKTIRNHIEEVRQHKVIAAVQFFFKQKDYSTFKIWDFRQENDSNLSIVNYYFHDKERIFNKLICQNTIALFNTLQPVLSDREKTAVEKFEFIVLEYINLLLEKPDFAIFLLNELLSESNKIDVIVIKKEKLLNSYFLIQLLELKKSRLNKFNPVQMLLNLIGMILLRIVSTDFYTKSTVIINKQFTEMIDERKKLLPLWISSMVQ